MCYFTTIEKLGKIIAKQPKDRVVETYREHVPPWFGRGRGQGLQAWGRAEPWPKSEQTRPQHSPCFPGNLFIPKEAAFPGLNARKGDSKEAGVRSFRVGLEDTRLHKKQ